MPRLDATIEEIQTPKRRRAYSIALTGVISTPTLETFRHLVRSYIESDLDIAIDMGNVKYINSSGLGEMVTLQDVLRQRDRNLLLFNLSEEVKQLLSMLGLNNFLHIFAGRDDALSGLDTGLKKLEAPPEGLAARATMLQVGDAVGPGRLGGKRDLAGIRVALGMPSNTSLGRFLRRCFSGMGGEVLEAHSAKDFSALLSGDKKGRKVHVAVLDSDIPEQAEITRLLKTNLDNGLVSVITMYTGNGPKAAPFRMMDDEYVAEPFEVRELVKIIESEYARCSQESLLFRQEAHLEINSTEASVARAAETVEGMLAQAGLGDEARESFLYAIREAIDNSRRHGNQSDESKLVDILYVLDREKITVTVEDEGPGFDFSGVLSEAGEASPVEQARKRHKVGKHGGLGINLMIRCCDKVEYLPPGNIVKLTKYV